MHVGDKDPPQLRQAQIAAQKLMLGALATVEQPHLRSLGQTQRHGGDVARPRGHSGTGTEKGDLHGR